MSAVSAFRDGVRRTIRGLDAWIMGPADDRAYGALRIGYALAAFAVLLDLWPFRNTLFADSGLFGGASPGQPLVPPNVFGIARSEGAVTVVLVVAALAIACLGLGIFPRAAAVVTYVWTLSYGATAPVSQSGFDTILRVVGFVIVLFPSYGPFRVLPYRPPDAPPRIYALRMIQWQLFLIYACTVWLKAPDPFWRNGEAVTYFMMSMFARFPNPAAADIGPAGALLDYGTLLIEITVPFLLWMRRTRWLGVLAGLALHVGIGVTSKLALFTLSIVPLYFAFFEREDFDRLARLFPRATPATERGIRT